MSRKGTFKTRDNAHVGIGNYNPPINFCGLSLDETGHMTTSFPESIFSASIVVEKTTMEAEKRDPGNEVGHMIQIGGWLSEDIRQKI